LNLPLKRLFFEIVFFEVSFPVTIGHVDCGPGSS
jgi:hypothetical protein